MTAVLFLLVAVVPAGWLAQVLAEAYHDACPRRQVAACSRRAAGRPGESRVATAAPWPVANAATKAVARKGIVVGTVSSPRAAVPESTRKSAQASIRSALSKLPTTGAAAVVCLWVVGLAAEAGL